MSLLSSFFGGEKTPTSIVNGFSTTGWTPTTQPATGAQGAAWTKQSLSGVCVAATLKTILSITGAGQLNFIGVSTVDTTARTMRFKITLDGVVVFDSTSASVSVAQKGGVLIGTQDNGQVNYFPTQSASFAASCLIEFASSVTETDKCNIFLAYKVN